MGNSDKEFLILKKDKLFKNSYRYKIKEYKNITSNFYIYLFDNCLIDKETTLRDIINFVEKDYNFWKKIVPFNLKDFIKTSKNIKKISKQKKQFLELYYRPKVIENNLVGFLYPNLHLIKNNKAYDISLSFEQILDCKIRLSDVSNIYFIDKKYKEVRDNIQIRNPEYSLISIIYGIFWELSYYGSPNSKNIEKIKKNLRNS